MFFKGKLQNKKYTSLKIFFFILTLFLSYGYNNTLYMKIGLIIA